MLFRFGGTVVAPAGEESAVGQREQGGRVVVVGLVLRREREGGDGAGGGLPAVYVDVALR